MKLRQTALFFLMVLLFAACRKDKTLIQEAITPNPTYALFAGARQWLADSGGVFKHGVLRVANERSTREYQLNWREAETFAYNGWNYLRVPFGSFTDTSLGAGCHLVFRRKGDEGPLLACFKQYSIMHKDAAPLVPLLAENIYGMDGILLDARQHDNGKIYKVQVIQKKPSTNILAMTCQVSGYSYMTVRCTGGAGYDAVCTFTQTGNYSIRCGEGTIKEDDPGYGGSGGGSGDPAYVYEEPKDEDVAAVSVKKMTDCFSKTPDNGAKYAARLCVDVPVNGFPAAPFSLSSPGHVFITLSKTVDGQTTSQSFGFYPLNGFKSIALLPVASAINNDGDNDYPHEYNASFNMPNLTYSQFQAIINSAYTSSQYQYDIDGYNCAGYALSVFNSIRPAGGTIGSDVISGPTGLPIPFSPQGVYSFLKNKNWGTEAANVEIKVVKAAPVSKGECN